MEANEHTIKLYYNTEVEKLSMPEYGRNVLHMVEQMKANDKVLDTPEPPMAEPLEGIPGGMSFTARAWTKTEDYWDVYFGLMEAIPTALGEAGVGGPLPAYHIVND